MYGYTSQYINSPVGAFADYARRAEVSSGRETQPPGEEILASLTGYTLPFVLYFPLVFAILTAVGPEYGPKALPLCVPTKSAVISAKFYLVGLPQLCSFHSFSCARGFESGFQPIPKK